MSLEQVKVVSQIAIDENGFVQVRLSTRVIDTDTGEQVAPDQYHRYVLEPACKIDLEPDTIKAVCAAVWTPDVITKFQKKKKAIQDEIDKQKK